MKKSYPIHKKSFNLLVISIVFLGILTGFATVVNTREKTPQPRTYLIDVENSQVFWRLDAHWGVIPVVEGKLVFEDQNMVDAYIKVHMDSLHNLDIDYKLMRIVLENTIKSKEVFQTEDFPYAYFRFYTSERVAKDTLLLAGDLEIKKIQNCIRFKTAVNFSEEGVTANTDTINVDRIRWGIVSMSKKFATGDEAYIISDAFKLQIRLYGVLKPDE